MLEIHVDAGPALEPESRGPFVRAKTEEGRKSDHIAPPLATAGDALQLPQLLERVDAHIRVRADADADPACAELQHRREAVAEVRLRGRADAHPGASVGEEVELARIGMGRVHDRRARAEAARICEQLDRAQAVLGEALLDLAWLLVGVDVQRQPLRGRVATELLEPIAGAGTHGV